MRRIGIMVNKTPVKITVTVRSLLNRLNRRLAEDDEAIRAPLGRTDRTELGDRFLIREGAIVECHLTPKRLEQMARDLNVLKPWEVLR
jgi:hypothetical protein